jgi:hypothetical protein
MNDTIFVGLDVYKETIAVASPSADGAARSCNSAIFSSALITSRSWSSGWPGNRRLSFCYEAGHMRLMPSASLAAAACLRLFDVRACESRLLTDRRDGSSPSCGDELRPRSSTIGQSVERIEFSYRFDSALMVSNDRSRSRASIANLSPKNSKPQFASASSSHDMLGPLFAGCLRAKKSLCQSVTLSVISCASIQRRDDST